MKLSYLSLFSLAILTLISCGGGGGGDDEGSVGGVISGRVIDGSVGSSRVCFDMNSDNQCSSSDSYVETDEQGYYEISYEEESIVEEYELIADVRYSESRDADYISGTPDYDYVMHAFDQDKDKANVISPLTTYMNHEHRITGDPASTVASNTVQIIEQYEQFTYSQEVEGEYEYTEYVQGDFILNQDSADQHEADFNQRVHNINEVLARQMQESQAVWEDRFYSGGLTLDSLEWADNSDLVVTNANSTVFQSFETIVEEVTSYNYSEFNALEVSTSLWVDLPSNAEIANLLTYVSAMEEYSQEFSGNTYRNSISFNGSLNSYGYYVFSSGGFTYYAEYIFDGADNICVFASAPFSATTGLSESEFVSQLNNTFQQVNQQGLGLTYSNLVLVSAPPIGCSSVGDVLASIDTASSIETALEGDIYDNSQDDCQPLCGFEPLPAIVTSPAPVKHVPSLSNNFSAGTLSSCGYDGNKYATNPCRTPSRKD